MDRLTEIEKRLERITNGEWIATCDPDAGKYSWTVATFGNSNIDGNDYEIVAKGPRASELIGDAKTDAEFAASAPTDISYLLGEVKRLQQENDQLRGKTPWLTMKRESSPLSTCHKCGEFLGHGHECAPETL